MTSSLLLGLMARECSSPPRSGVGSADRFSPPIIPGDRDRNHGLISRSKVRAWSGGQPITSCAFRNALVFIIGFLLGMGGLGL